MGFFMVSLLNSTDTVEEFEDRIMQKKMKIPKMSIKNSGNSFENCYGEERMPLRHKKVGCAGGQQLRRHDGASPLLYAPITHLYPTTGIAPTFTTTNQNDQSTR